MTRADKDAGPPGVPGIADVLALCERFSNWGRWGDDDWRGTLNHVTGEDVVAASRLVRKGTPFSLALPYDEHGPQSGMLGRFNPIHLMTRVGADALVGSSVRDFFGGVDHHFTSTDDIVIMPLQCGTQWDSLAHVVHLDKIYLNTCESAPAFRREANRRQRTGAADLRCNGVPPRAARLRSCRRSTSGTRNARPTSTDARAARSRAGGSGRRSRCRSPRRSVRRSTRWR